MFIGHLPAGYLATHGILKLVKIDKSDVIYRRLMWTGLIAAIAPYFDLIYFYLIDNRQTLHHHYFTHTPYFWFSFFFFTSIVAFMSGSRAMMMGSALIFINSLIHLFLDTIVGKIKWGWPFIWHDTVFFDVPSVHDWWVLNFVLHWSFLFECLLLVIFCYVYCDRKKYRRR